MRGIIPGLILCLAFGGCNQKEKAAETAGKDGPASPAPPKAQGDLAGELVIQAEILDIPGQFPPNDIYNYAYVMRYRVVEVLQGEWPDAEILIGHYNPRVARDDIHDEKDSLVGGNVKSFQVKDRHRLVLAKMDKVWSGAVEDEYFQDQSVRYWAVWADKL